MKKYKLKFRYILHNLNQQAICITCVCTYTEPSQPKELTVNKDGIGETLITVSWKEPKPSDVSITSYEVQYRENGEEFKKVEKSLTHEDLTCEVTGLVAHTEYQFRVAAINAAGRGPFTDVVTQFTSESLYKSCSDSYTYVHPDVRMCMFTRVT